MSNITKCWLIGIAAVLGIFLGGAFIAGRLLLRRIEPMVHDQAVRYLHDRFRSDVELAELHIDLPRVSTLGLVFHKQRGAVVRVDGVGLKMTRPGTSIPMLSVDKLHFNVDIASVLGSPKIVDSVLLEGVHITVPPKGQKPAVASSTAPPGKAGKPSQPLDVQVQQVDIRNAVLTILPRDPTRNPMNYTIDNVRLTPVARQAAMHYDADLSIPKPPGHVLSNGNFGPWNSDEPGDTPLDGNYKFEHADLGIFNGIAGTLESTGEFAGSLSAFNAKGEAYVPDFRLKMSGNKVPLRTRFQVLVDGTNGNTVLQPVDAILGTTHFTTTGGVVKHDNDPGKRIDLQVNMPDGNLPDLLRLAMKGPAFMEGRVNLKTRIAIPAMTGTVKQKLILDGTFNVRNGKFLRSTLQSQLDNLSRHAQGEPKNEEIDAVASNLRGSFRLESQVMTFRSVSFAIPGAQVELAGTYNLAGRDLDFRGTAGLTAKLSEMVTGWKSVLLKAVDPLFEKNGAGTYLHIKIQGDVSHPRFGVDLFGKGKK